jgi:hypothetical protein
VDEALTRWCEQQPDMVAHKGLCLVHRAEIMTLAGAWRDALEEARRVARQFTQGVLNQRALGMLRTGRRRSIASKVSSIRPRPRTGRQVGSGVSLSRVSR